MAGVMGVRGEMEDVNRRFNEELERQVRGELPVNHIYTLGFPGEILRSAGIPDLPIELSADRLFFKAGEGAGHPFDISTLKDLPWAINSPIAVFDSTRGNGNKVILTELRYNGNNIVVVMRVWKSDSSRKVDIWINDIRSIYPKDYVQGIIDWINSEDNLLQWVDKEKALNFISTQLTTKIGGGDKAKAIGHILAKTSNVISVQ